MVAGPIISEVEGGLSGPAHPISNQSLDCGCKQMPCPKLAKFATRKLFVGIVCWIGIVQASAQAYYRLTSSTIARRFQIEPEAVEWLSLTSNGIFPLILAIPVAYWGDRIHRAAWTGALTLLQSFGFFLLIILHLTQPSSRVTEETTNITHLPLYSDEHPELCSTAELDWLSIKEWNSYHINLIVIIAFHILNCMGNIAYLALTISYLDDNTRKRDVAIPMSFIIAVKVFGMLFGYLLAWGCLRIDTDNLSSQVSSYREQIGAWWLGWPILAVLLALGGLPMSWMPRRLISEVVQEAAESILDLAGRTSPISESTLSESPKHGDILFFKSLTRLVTNKILICKIFASVFCLMALINFFDNEDIYLESRFYVPRPEGLHLGFNDKFLSRLISALLRPIIISFIIVISGIIIVKFRPRAKYLIGYNVIVITIAAIIIITLALFRCTNPPIRPNQSNRHGSLILLKSCNANCRCSKNANFFPICDTKNSFTFYTPCHAGCTSVDDTDDVKKFTGCSCIKETTGRHEAIEGPCGSVACQYGWIVFQISTTTAYSLVASAAVGSFLIGLRSIYIQDKALAIGLWITIASIFIYIMGKSIYWKIANLTCIHHGNPSSLCYLHHFNFGNYLAYVTALLLAISISFELLLYLLCQKMKLYREPESDCLNEVENPTQATPLMIEEPLDRSNVPPENLDFNPITTSGAVVDVAPPPVISENIQRSENDIATTTTTTTTETPQLYSKIKKTNGPVRYEFQSPSTIYKMTGINEDGEKNLISDTDVSDDDDNDGEPSGARLKHTPLSLSTISYHRLEGDSDDDSNVSGSNYESIKLNQADREFQRSSKSLTKISQPLAGFSRVDDIEFTEYPMTKPKLYRKKNERPKTGDFNEVGIPIVDYPLTSMNSRSIGSILMAAKLQTAHRKSPGTDDEKSPSLTEHTSSGFGSTASDLHKIPKKSSQPYLPAYSTAL